MPIFLSVLPINVAVIPIIVSVVPAIVSVVPIIVSVVPVIVSVVPIIVSVVPVVVSVVPVVPVVPVVSFRLFRSGVPGFITCRVVLFILFMNISKVRKNVLHDVKGYPHTHNSSIHALYNRAI